MALRRVYWSGSQATHANAMAVENYLAVASGGRPLFRLRLSVKHLGAERTAPVGSEPGDAGGGVSPRRGGSVGNPWDLLAQATMASMASS